MFRLLIVIFSLLNVSEVYSDCNWSDTDCGIGGGCQIRKCLRIALNAVTSETNKIPNIITKVTRVVGATIDSTGKSVLDFSGDILADTQTILSDADRMLNSIGNRLGEKTQKLLDGIHDDLSANTQFMEDLFNNNLIKNTKVNQLKNSAQTMLDSFDKGINVNDIPGIDMFFKGLLQAGVFEGDLIDTFIESIDLVISVKDTLFDNNNVFKSLVNDLQSNPPISRRRRRIISGAYTSSGGQYESVVKVCQDGGLIDNTLNYNEAKMVYTDGNVYSQYHTAKTVFEIFSFYFNLVDELIDECLSIDEAKCPVHLAAQTVVALLDTYQWIMEIFLNAADLHDGVLQTTQIDAIYQQQLNMAAGNVQQPPISNDNHMYVYNKYGLNELQFTLIIAFSGIIIILILLIILSKSILNSGYFKNKYIKIDSMDKLSSSDVE